MNPLRILRDLVIWTVIGIISFPFLWMVLTSIKPRDQTVTFPPRLLSDRLTLEHYQSLLFDTPFLQLFANSLFVAGASTLVAILIATSGAYGLLRYRFPARGFAAQMMLFSYLLPAVVLLVPLYVVVAALGLGDSLWGLIITYTTFAIPFALWLLRGFLSALSPEVEAAAAIDGAGRLEIFFEIVLPQVLPGIVATAVFTFIMGYNEYLYAMVFINRAEIMTLPPGVSQIVTEAYEVDWNRLMAAAVMITLPILLLFAVVQRNFSAGLGAGSVKG